MFIYDVNDYIPSCYTIYTYGQNLAYDNRAPAAYYLIKVFSNSELLDIRRRTPLARQCRISLHIKRRKILYDNELLEYKP